MIHIIVYEQDTGKITKSRSVSKIEDADIQCEEGESWILGSVVGPLRNYIVSGGTLTKKSDEEIREQETPEAWVKLRKKRDTMLSSCDWTQVPDAPTDQSAWAIYRQALRDLPANTTDPFNPPWPTKPQ